MDKKGSEKRGLGRGLSALMAESELTENDLAEQSGVQVSKAPDTVVPIEKLHPNPDQPRRDFSSSDMDDLAASIREKGIIQPLIVRWDPELAGEYQIVAGERRWRAAQTAGLHEIPILIKDLNDTEVLEIAIIENIQRSNLNAVEEAVGFRQLMDRFGHTQEKLAEALGKSRSHIANLLRLLTLPDEVLGYLREGKISAGHARALVTSENSALLARKTIAKGLSVRQVEKLAKGITHKAKKSNDNNPLKDADTKALELDLAANIGMKVSIDHKDGSETGVVSITYENFDQLDRLCQILSATILGESK